ncbi:cell division protein PerM [Microbacterium sp. RD1]|uniref:cell division protein PerM n=1 Tax=Microbacterium sp. RD1 TaxID=3457313 RepID=UPI003FA546C4
MNRLLVALLAAFDAVLAGAGGIALALAPLTLLWVFGIGGGADWGALWPSSAVLWQFGHLVPVTVALPDGYLAAAGIDPAAAEFVLSLAPLGFAAFTALFAARSGGRAARAGEATTGAVSASVVFAAISAAVAFTGAAPLARVELWQAILFPSLVFVVPCLLGAGTGAWIADRTVVRVRVEKALGTWASVPGLVVRGTASAVLGLVAVGAIVLAVGVFAGAGQIVALFEAGNVDALGAVVLALGQLAYLPTLVVWALSFVAGPGFALGTGTAVSPSGTQLGVLPGIPVLGAVPESSSSWLLLLALVPVAVGAGVGWMLRSRLAAEHPRVEPYGPRLTVLAGTTVLTAAVAALLAVCARGSLGPGRLTEMGPEPGPVAAAVGLEIAVGLAILLLSPRRRAPSAADDADGARTALSVDAPSRIDGAPSFDTSPLPSLPVHAFAAGVGAPSSYDDLDAELPAAPEDAAPEVDPDAETGPLEPLDLRALAVDPPVEEPPPGEDDEAEERAAPSVD